MFKAYRGSFPGTKRPGHDVYRSSPSTAKGKNERSRTCTSPIRLQGVDRGETLLLPSQSYYYSYSTLLLLLYHYPLSPPPPLLLLLLTNNCLNFSFYFPVASKKGFIYSLYFPQLHPILNNRLPTLDRCSEQRPQFCTLHWHGKPATCVLAEMKSLSVNKRRFAVLIIAGGTNDGTSVPGSTMQDNHPTCSNCKL